MARGHDAWSCDLLPSERPGKHLHGNVGHWLGKSWDLLIGHPPCTYLSNSGVRWLYGGKGKVKDPLRWQAMEQARDFFLALWQADIERICLENPIPHKHARLPRYAQIIQPWHFGEPFQKATCLWLKNLPPLQPTCIVNERKQKAWYESPGPERWKNRSRTYPGIAKAMAETWG